MGKARTISARVKDGVASKCSRPNGGIFTGDRLSEPDRPLLDRRKSWAASGRDQSSRASVFCERPDEDCSHTRRAE